MNVRVLRGVHLELAGQRCPLLLPLCSRKGLGVRDSGFMLPCYAQKDTPGITLLFLNLAHATACHSCRQDETEKTPWLHLSARREGKGTWDVEVGEERAPEMSSLERREHLGCRVWRGKGTWDVEAVRFHRMADLTHLHRATLSDESGGESEREVEWVREREMEGE